MTDPIREALEELVDTASNYVKPRRTTDARQVLLVALDAARAALAATVAQPAICKTVTFALSDADAEELLGKGFAKYSDALAMVQEAFDMGVSAALAAPIVAQPLTREQLHAIYAASSKNCQTWEQFARDVERAHGIGKP